MNDKPWELGRPVKLEDGDIEDLRQRMQGSKPVNDLAERTDQFDVVLDLASTTLADGDTVCAMRLARGVMALSDYADGLVRRLTDLERVLDAARLQMNQCDAFGQAQYTTDELREAIRACDVAKQGGGA